MTVTIKIINILSGKQNRSEVVKANNNKKLYNNINCYNIEGYTLCDYRGSEAVR